jgi:transcriptional regulator with XRE-family HTH domain
MPILRFVHTLAREDALVVMTMRESWTSYVRRITEGLPRKDIARAADVNVSAVSRWLGGDAPSPQKVISFARGLRQSPIKALVAAGYLDETDVGDAVEIVQSLAVLSDDALIDELHGRLRRRDAQQPKTGLARVEPHLSRKGMGVEDPDNGGKQRG